MKKILIVEDDIWISNSLKIYLESSNFEIDTDITWELAVQKVKSNNFDLVILDLNLPKKDWNIICKEIREFSNLPIIMLTARTSEFEKINWLELWADDYISKPFSPRELLARINTIFRRIDNVKENSDLLRLDEIEIDLKKCIVKKSWNIINLTKNEFDIFIKIFKENWEMVKRETLMIDVIWYDNYIFDRTIDTHIKNIRKKLDNKDIILTIRWKWYRLNK